MTVNPNAPYVLLTSEEMRDVKIFFNPDDRVSVLTPEGMQVKAERGTIKRLTLREFSMSNVPCALYPVQSGAKHCVLGADFLEHFNYEIDSKAGELRVAPPGQELISDRRSATTSPAPATTRPNAKPPHP